jgi:site-specific DNA-methyltransferase (adenine-specific)
MDELTIIIGDCLTEMKKMEPNIVDCCVTSPPYFGLRDYGSLPNQIGQESQPKQYIEKMVEVFREVKRLLKDDGVLWLNIGDSYASQGGGQVEQTVRGKKNHVNSGQLGAKGAGTSRKPPEGVKAKDLIGIPWMLAFALREDGWYLRQDIIWNKPNPMPESVRDRCTRSHEYIFLLSKKPKYYFDNQIIKEPVVDKKKDAKRNKRSVWNVATKPYKGAHFATFPPDLIEPCILSGCREGGIVLDPFGGSGTTAGVANVNDRKAIICELNAEYVDLMEERIDSIKNKRKKCL